MMLSLPRTTCPRFSNFSLLDSKALKAALLTAFVASRRRTWICCLKVTDFCWWNLVLTMWTIAGNAHSNLWHRCSSSRTLRLRAFTPPRNQNTIWQIGEAGPRAAAFAPGAPAEWEGWDDAAIAPEKLGVYLRDIRKLMDEYGYRGAFYGHFGHGCIHMRVSFDLESESGIRNYSEFVNRAADLVVGYGGSLSGEHGDGQSRGALLPKMFGAGVDGCFP